MRVVVVRFDCIEPPTSPEQVVTVNESNCLHSKVIRDKSWARDRNISWERTARWFDEQTDDKRELFKKKWQNRHTNLCVALNKRGSSSCLDFLHSCVGKTIQAPPSGYPRSFVWTDWNELFRKILQFFWKSLLFGKWLGGGKGSLRAQRIRAWRF